MADDWLEFIGDAKLIAHNATFDMNFLNYELKQISKKQMSWDNCIDTLELARSMFPGAKCSLDALWKSFEIDNSARTYHGALLVSEFLAEVYLELLGGKEPSLLLDSKKESKKNNTVEFINDRKYREPRIFEWEENIEELHNSFLDNKIKNPIWKL